MKPLGILFALSAACLPLVSCGGGSDNKGAQNLVMVSAGTVQRKDVPLYINSVGTIEASQSVNVVSQVAGVLSDVHFSEGQYVKQGDLLFSIDRRPFAAKVREEEANLAKARAELKNAEATFKRYQALVGKEYVTREQFDQSRAAFESSKASVGAAEATLENSKLDLEYTEIRAPIEGKTGALLIKPGNVIKAENLESPLVSIQKIRPALARFAVSENFLQHIREANSAGSLRVTVRPKGEGVKSIDGELSFIDNAVSQSTGTILLKAIFDNANDLLWAGQFVEVSLLLKTIPNALVVPGAAIQTGQEGQYVWVIKPDQSVESRLVKTDFEFGGETVVSSGLQGGDTVVTDGQLKVGPGTRVKIKETASGNDSANSEVK